MGTGNEIVDGGEEGVAAVAGTVEEDEVGGVGKLEGLAARGVEEVVVEGGDVDGTGPEVVLTADDEGGSFDVFGVPVLIAVRHVEAFAAITAGDAEGVLGIPRGGLFGIDLDGCGADVVRPFERRDRVVTTVDDGLFAGFAIEGDMNVITIAVGGVGKGSVETPGPLDSVERVQHDEMIDFVVVQGGVIAGPMAAGGPAEKIDFLQVFVFPNVIYYGVDVFRGFLAGAGDETGVGGVISRGGGALPAADIHDIDVEIVAE